MNSIYLLLCVGRLSLAFAYDDLAYNKLAAQSHTHPGTLYDASNAVDRNIGTCMRTELIGQSSIREKVWWKVNLGGDYNIYSINIQFKTYDAGNEFRQRGRFAGFSLYISNSDVTTNDDIQSFNLCYKDGPELPPLNFTATCTEHGQFVIYYNERLNGVKYPDGYEQLVYTELCEVIVQGCERSGVYGNNCNIPCPLNCKNNICHIKNGSCFTCKPGWTGETCKTECQKGWYGPNCSQECEGHCTGNTHCNHETGQCDGGCDAGWTGFLCEQECNFGTFGTDCINNCSTHCFENSTCNRKTGKCDMGCSPGYNDEKCSKKCSPGKYGMDCKETCGGHCKNDEACDYVSGECRHGCMNGYIGQQCKNACKEGFYGKNCSSVCYPNCKTCQHTDGMCSCLAGWMGYNCTTECVKSHGENCRYQCHNCINETCDRFNGSCTHGNLCNDEEKCRLETKLDTLSNSLHGTIGGTVGACVIVIGVAIAVFILRFKRKTKQLTNRESIELRTKPRFAMEPLKNASSLSEATYALPDKTKKDLSTKKNISVRNIKSQITNMSAKENAGFKSEYYDIPRGEQHPSLEARKPENKIKNRYTTIYPYDHSRVILKTPLSVDGDYINANYIEDARGKHIYIATQGPKPKTISDFWTMIWQEEVFNIVCLTNLKEGTKNKCAQYWPDVNDKLQGGTLTIRHLDRKTYSEYIIRRFKIHNNSTKTDRHVTMFHYTTWSDHGVADPLSLVVFHRHVIRDTANSAGKYTVVHCSAGVGRTGTYIALDALYREGEITGKINVPMYVRAMRKDRMNMIQGDEQYKLLYLSLMEAFSGPSRCMTTEKFLGVYQEQTCYTNCGDVVQKSFQSSEFEELQSLRKEYTQQDYTAGRAQISANYTQSVLPVEKFMCHLSYIKGHNTYYNAVLLQSYLEKDSLISAQYPLPDNTEDFLRLMKDFDARVVVFLCPLKDIESTPTWFPTDNQSKLNGLFFIENLSTTKAPNVTKTKLNIQPQGFSEMGITVIDCPTWREGKETADKRVLLDVIKAVKTEKSDQEGHIIVLSSDGATRCGPFFVVYNVLEQISVDREVDIFTTTRQLQVRRPEFVSTLEEYQLCHDTVAEYLLNDCVYGNC